MYTLFALLRPLAFPNIQLRVNFDDVYEAQKALSGLRWCERVALEVGATLLKAEGLISISLLRKVWPEAFIVVDLRAERGEEARLASIGGADGATVLARADVNEIEKFIELCHSRGIMVYLISEAWPETLLKALRKMPDVVIVERGPFPKGGPKVGIVADRRWDGKMAIEGVDVYVVEEMVWGDGDPARALAKLVEAISTVKSDR